MANKRAEIKLKRWTLWVDPAWLAEIDEWRKSMDAHIGYGKRPSRAEIIREAVKDYLERYGVQ
jgi:hypothetical protein